MPQKSLLAEALKYYPKLRAGMKAYEAARNVPAPDFDDVLDDDDDDVPEPDF